METNNNNNNNNNNSNSNLTNNNVSWDHIWDNNNISGTNSQSATTTRYDWTNLPFSSATSSRREQQQPEASVVHALLFGNTAFHDAGRVGWPDPHMMCLKLGKRHYCDDTVVGVPDRCVMTAESSSAAAKRGKLPLYQVTDSRWPGVRVTSSTRCQVEGCNVALGNAKEYYRRHKVCEIHSKAPKVVVSGLQQRFCQQCSRFHDVTEFDEAKRSCRRRLEGHNLRRRKGTVSHSIPRNFPQSHENNSTMEHQLGPLSTLQSSSSSPSKPVCALSLLSSSKTEPWIPSGDLSLRCSAALYELICANRATSASGHFFNQNSSHQPILDNTMHTSHDTNRSSRTTMTLDVKQAPALDFGLLAMKEESKDPDVWTDYCWSPFGGANVV